MAPTLKGLSIWITLGGLFITLLAANQTLAATYREKWIATGFINTEFYSKTDPDPGLVCLGVSQWYVEGTSDNNPGQYYRELWQAESWKPSGFITAPTGMSKGAGQILPHDIGNFVYLRLRTYGGAFNDVPEFSNWLANAPTTLEAARSTGALATRCANKDSDWIPVANSIIGRSVGEYGAWLITNDNSGTDNINRALSGIGARAFPILWEVKGYFYEN